MLRDRGPDWPGVVDANRELARRRVHRGIRQRGKRTVSAAVPHRTGATAFITPHLLTLEKELLAKNEFQGDISSLRLAAERFSGGRPQ